MLVCLLTIILWLSFQFACFYFCYSPRLCVCCLLVVVFFLLYDLEFQNREQIKTQC